MNAGSMCWCNDPYFILCNRLWWIVKSMGKGYRGEMTKALFMGQILIS